MSWFNADDKMHSHAKPRQAGLEAMGLWLLSGTYCTDYLTDGLVPGWYVQSWPKGARLAQKLIDVKLWERAGDDYQFLSWDEYQRTKSKVMEERAASRERMARSRAERAANVRANIGRSSTVQDQYQDQVVNSPTAVEDGETSAADVTYLTRRFANGTQI